MNRLILWTAITAATSAQPAHDLARQARAAALDRADWKKAQSLINEAIKRWERDQEPHDADYARALDLSGMLAQYRKADLATVVEPLYREALDILDHADSGVSESDTAVALELEALALKDLGRSLDAAPFKERALRIRTGIVPDVAVPSASPPATPAPSRIGAGVKPPVVIYKVEPAYTELARLVKIQGTVVLGLVVNTDGMPQDFRLLRSVGFGLDEEAVRVVNAWRFRPGFRDGTAVAVQVTIELNFKLL